jgi:hypothetical protein
MPISCYECCLVDILLLVVELDYLPDSEVLCFSAVFIPHEDFTPQKYVHSSTQGSAEGGYPLCGVQGGLSPQLGGSGAKPPKEKLPCKSIL